MSDFKENAIFEGDSVSGWKLIFPIMYIILKKFYIKIINFKIYKLIMIAPNIFIFVAEKMEGCCFKKHFSLLDKALVSGNRSIRQRVTTKTEKLSIDRY